MRMRRGCNGWSAVGTNVVGILVCALAFSAPGAAALSTGPGRIVFAADRSPLDYGEIFRIGVDGSRVDLSRSAASDVGPVLSPDGSQVAFASNRGGHAALYVVRSDGTGLHRISPLFFSSDNAKGVGAQIAWTRDGKELAAGLNGYGSAQSGLWIGDSAGHGRIVDHAGITAPVWSPDGTELAYQPTGPTGGAEIDVVSRSGKLRWYVRGDFGAVFGWGAKHELAVSYNKTVSVYDEHGGKLAAYPGSSLAWSPDGTELASLQGPRLQVRDGGVGEPVVDSQLAGGHASGGNEIEWLGNDRLRVATDAGTLVGFDVAHDRPLQLPASYTTFQGPLVVSGDGNELALVTGVPAAESATLSVDTFAGAVGPTLVTGPPCTEQPWFQSLQFTPDGRALVYETGCAEPSADIYSIGGDGRGLRRLTDTPVDETQPAWSPDGTRIAYVQQPVANKCEGCPDSLWLMNADGSNEHRLTTESDGHWDVHPSWSPDGTRLLFSHLTFTSTGLRTIPPAGGAARTVPGKGSYPSWGPSRIAYMRGDVGPTLIQTARPDGSDPQTVGSDSNALLPTLAWSGSGRLAYLRTDGTGHLYLVVVGTHTRVRLGGLEAADRDSGLAWSPDGLRLAFEASDTEGVSDIWRVNADGTHLTRLTHGLGTTAGLAWTD